jgi:hypothetical protein
LGGDIGLINVLGVAFFATILFWFKKCGLIVQSLKIELFMHVLSIPTWIIHTSSVLEWLFALWLIWNYGEVQQSAAWKWFAVAMLPALVSAMCACTWHFFDNAPDLEWLVTLQATMTLVGNFTLWWAAWGLGRSQVTPTPKPTPSPQPDLPPSP